MAFQRAAGAILLLLLAPFLALGDDNDSLVLKPLATSSGAEKMMLFIPGPAIVHRRAVPRSAHNL